MSLVPRSGAIAAWCLALAGAAGCPAAPPPAPVANTARVPASAPREHDAIVAAVLDRFVAKHETLADAGLLPDQGPLYVLTEIGEAPDAVTRIGALPRAARPYVGKTLAELNAEADRRGDTVAFIRIYSLTIEGEQAQVSSGVDVALPAARREGKLCCCLAEDTYQKRAGRWTFVRRGSQICS